MDSGNYGYVALFLVGGIGFVAFNLTLSSLVSRFIGAHRPGKSKGIAYECGEPPTGEAWVQYNVRYYLYAMMFVLFDVEAAFLVPWAAQFRTLYHTMGAVVLLEMVSFISLLCMGLAYAWRKGALEWV